LAANDSCLLRCKDIYKAGRARIFDKKSLKKINKSLSAITICCNKCSIFRQALYGVSMPGVTGYMV
jgi:hypothetical protein